jgi:putative glutamine amidotransferase
MKKPSEYKYYTSTCGPSNGHFLEPIGFEHTSNLKDADLIVFGGGADVDPKTYGEEPSTRTWSSPAREKKEKEDFQEGLKLGKKFFGICRGQQLLCSLGGGKLIQDVNNHSGGHDITTFDGLTFPTNSIHHQMINPYVMGPENYKILAWSTKRRSTRYLGAKDKNVYLPWHFKEIEAIYFPKIRGLGVQYHPEMMYSGSRDAAPVIQWTQSIINKLMNNQL